MEQQIAIQINALIRQLEELRKRLDNGISEGKAFSEMKAVFLQIKELSHLIEEQGRALGRDTNITSSHSNLSF